MPSIDAIHERFMALAVAQARRGLEAGEVPIGAVLVSAEGEILATGWNRPIGSADPTAHAEIVALRAGAVALGNYRLTGATLYVTLEPCLMCVGALISARIATLVYGAAEPKWGAVRSILDIGAVAANHRFDVVAGIMEEACRTLVVNFFKTRRAGLE